MEKDHVHLTVRADAVRHGRWRHPRWRHRRKLKLLVIASILFIAYAQWRQLWALRWRSWHRSTTTLDAQRLREDVTTCAKLRSTASPPAGPRERNARYIDGHPPVLIRNATVWTGEPVAGTTDEEARRGVGWAWIQADVLMEKGLIQRVETAGSIDTSALPSDTIVFEARGRAVTAGIVDMHSHAGIYSQPGLVGTEDTNEVSSPITPYVRSIDGIQPNDHQIQVIKSGGVTTSLILPGSANNMGGEAYVVKLAVGREDGRNETSIADMLADTSGLRYMKMACGENPKRIYGSRREEGPSSRLGESWEFRHAFEQAAKLVREQDDWCNTASERGVEHMRTYLPTEIRWESLGALLRGQMRLNVHCYTIPDIEAFIDHSNTFRFVVQAFHHAHQSYLVPEVLKRAWGGVTPALALFATNMWYKTEAYTGSEYAGKRLYQEGLVPIYVSDNPVLNAQHLIGEAAKAYKFGLPFHAAMASVTTAPAERLGLGERLGKVVPGFDADVVVWDSLNPLVVGSTPVQVFIDGTAQYSAPVELNKPLDGFLVPDTKLAEMSEEPTIIDDVVFTGVTNVLLSTDGGLDGANETPVNVVIANGTLACIGQCTVHMQTAVQKKVKMIHLANGYLTESFTAFGSGLGLNTIDSEKDTANGSDDDKAFSRAEDGIKLDDKKLHVAYRYGVTKAVSAPRYSGEEGHHGVSTAVLTGAANALDQGAVFVPDVAVHYTLSLSVKSTSPSISAAVGALRKRLLDAASSNDTDSDAYSEQAYLRKVVAGRMPLVLTVHSADTIAAILKVKAVVDDLTGSSIRLVILGGAEAWLLARELADAKVGVVLAPLFSYRTTWDQRRALTGAPLTNGTGIDKLVSAGVVTAIGLEEDWLVRDLTLLAGAAYKNSEGRVKNEREALELMGKNFYTMLGLKHSEPMSGQGHFVVFEGSPLETDGRVRAIGGGMGAVTIFE